MDWKNIVDQLIQIERVPQQRKEVERYEAEQKKSTLSEIMSELETLNGATGKIADKDLFYGREADSLATENAILSASANPRTLTGTYEFHIDQLATASKLSGSADVGTAITDTATTLSQLNTATVPTSGSITVNGAQVAIDAGDTLQQTMDKIVDATRDGGGAATLQVELTASDTLKITSLTGDPAVRLGSASDDSNFLKVMKLFSNESGTAESTSKIGAVNLNATVDSSYSGLSSPPASDGSFFINGEEISFDADVDSIKSVMERINESEAGVKISYDATGDGFSLTSTDTGSLDIAVDDNGSGFLTSLGLTGQTTALGVNAQFRIGSSREVIESTSNTLDSTAHGIDGLTVTTTGTGTERVEVKANNDGALSTVESFIDKYNNVVSLIAQKTAINVSDGEVTASTLAGDRDLNEMARKLRQNMFQAVSGLDGGVKRLSDIGIEFKSNSNEIELTDSALFEDFLKSDPDKVAKLFTDETDGIAERIDQYTDELTKDGSALEIRQDNLTERVEAIGDDIARLERMITVKRDELEASFIAMENAQGQINSQMSCNRPSEPHDVRARAPSRPMPAPALRACADAAGGAAPGRLQQPEAGREVGAAGGALRAAECLRSRNPARDPAPRDHPAGPYPRRRTPLSGDGRHPRQGAARHPAFFRCRGNARRPR